MTNTVYYGYGHRQIVIKINKTITKITQSAVVYFVNKILYGNPVRNNFAVEVLKFKPRLYYYYYSCGLHFERRLSHGRNNIITGNYAFS